MSGKVEFAKNNPYVSQIVTTSTGEQLTIPTMLGSQTKIKALKDGTYEVTTKASYYGAKPETKILTEEELVARYGQKTGQNLQVVA